MTGKAGTERASAPSPAGRQTSDQAVTAPRRPAWEAQAKRLGSVGKAQTVGSSPAWRRRNRLWGPSGGACPRLGSEDFLEEGITVGTKEICFLPSPSSLGRRSSGKADKPQPRVSSTMIQECTEKEAR